jgi:hypothetical protein
MKNKQKERKELIKAAAKAMITRDLTEWPPGCVGFAYQPMRPNKNENKQLNRN